MRTMVCSVELTGGDGEIPRIKLLIPSIYLLQIPKVARLLSQCGTQCTMEQELEPPTDLAILTFTFGSPADST